jgi:D-serine deaminase-like pyridoxal phosphate-dependent protein
VPLAQLLEKSRSLELIGLLSHAGHAYGAGSLAAIRDIAESERKQMLFAQECLSAAGLPVSKLSVGSTPTVLAAECFDGLTEIRPGSYIFFDLTAVRLGVAELNDVALSVLTSVVSVNDEYTIFDAGSKALSSDLGPHGTVGAKGFGTAFLAQTDICEERSPESLLVEKLSEEHGFLKSGNRKMAVGDRLRIVPNHCCPVANLARELVWVEEGKEIQHWRVAAAGKVL